MRTLVKFETPSGKTVYVPYNDGKKVKKCRLCGYVNCFCQRNSPKPQENNGINS
jgi:hypothetical protein